MAIGGRGSGKSTLLEYLRWGLCDQPVSVSDDASEVPNFEKRRGSLIKSTLQRSHGGVTIEYMISGVRHLIRREADSEKVFLTIQGEAEKEVSLSLIQGMTRLQGYSQKQLSNVSVRNDELLRLVKSPIKAELDQVESSDVQCATRLRSAFQARESFRALNARRSAAQTELSSKRSQIDSLRADIGDLPATQKIAIDEHGAFVAGQRATESYVTTFGSLSNDLENLADRIETERLNAKSANGVQPQADVADLRDQLIGALDVVRVDVLAAKDTLDAAKKFFEISQDVAANKLASHNAIYEAATSQNAVIQEHLNQMRTLSQEVDGLGTTLDEVEREIADLGDVEQKLRDARDEWKLLGDQEFRLLGDQATALTAASKGELRVDVTKGAIAARLTQAFVEAVRGAQVFEEKIARCVKTVSSSQTPFDEWLGVVDELLSVVDAERGGPPAIVPKLASAGFGSAELKRIGAKLTPFSAFELSLQRPATYPSFSYRAPDDSYIPFEQASPGQQANALLALLFGQAVGPLLIDQPEDDLDNATALQIAESIWPAKQRRQLIVATHNPNLLVIGDAELVLHCSHFSPPKAEAQVGITVAGGIDDKAVRQVITDVMEGGQNAFILRMNRYGF